jgi:hypothetical protein
MIIYISYIVLPFNIPVSFYFGENIRECLPPLPPKTRIAEVPNWPFWLSQLSLTTTMHRCNAVVTDRCDRHRPLSPQYPILNGSLDVVPTFHAHFQFQFGGLNERQCDKITINQRNNTIIISNPFFNIISPRR